MSVYHSLSSIQTILTTAVAVLIVSLIMPLFRKRFQPQGKVSLPLSTQPFDWDYD